jgi:hypothetical protein
MRGKTVLIVLVAVLATAASTFVATRAITGTVSDGRTVTASAETDPGEIQSKGTEVALLVGDIEEAESEEAVKREDRDPLAIFRRRPAPNPTPPPSSDEPAAPTWPAYTVTAVLVGDDDPRAFLRLGGESLSVGLGDEVRGGRVVAIESDGVTIEGEAGRRKFPF